MWVWECPVAPSAISGITDLAAEEIAEHAAAPQVPDDGKAPAVANEDLVGIPRMFLQSLHHFKHAPLAGLLWQPGRGGHCEPTPMSIPGPWPTAWHSWPRHSVWQWAWNVLAWQDC